MSAHALNLFVIASPTQSGVAAEALALVAIQLAGLLGELSRCALGSRFATRNDTARTMETVVARQPLTS